MKCPKCGGTAELSNWGSYTDPDYADFHVECEKCGYHSMGSTDPQKAKEMFEKEMGMYYTNEQWLSRLSTKEKAEWIFRLTYKCYWCGREYTARSQSLFNEKECPFKKCMKDKKDFEKWLKGEHKA